MLGLFKRKDPVCGMKEEKGKGIDDKETGQWFCSEQCKEEFLNASSKQNQKSGCCCH